MAAPGYPAPIASFGVGPSASETSNPGETVNANAAGGSAAPPARWVCRLPGLLSPDSRSAASAVAPQGTPIEFRSNCKPPTS